MVLSVASGLAGSRRTADATRWRPRSRWSGGGGDDRPGLDRDGRRDHLVGRQQAAAAERPARDGDPDRGVAVRAVEPVGAEQRGDPGGQPFGDVVGQRDVETGRRPAQAGDVLGELGRVRAADPQRLEDAVAELEAAIEDRQVGAVGGQQPAVDPDVAGRLATCDGVAALTRPPPPPIAPSGPRALVTVSSHSAAGSLFQVIPPPTWRVRRRPSATKVRMTMLVCIAPSGPIQPMAPVYGPRRTGSRPSRISIARIFGAPVIEPPGNDAASRSNASRSSARTPVTVETRCWTAAVRSRRQSRGTRTVPGRQTRPRSLRRTSTIITFSARSLALDSSSRASARSVGGVATARAGALDRVGRDDAAARRPTGTARARPTGAPAAARSAGPVPRSR